MGMYRSNLCIFLYVLYLKDIVFGNFFVMGFASEFRRGHSHVILEDLSEKFYVIITARRSNFVNAHLCIGKHIASVRHACILQILSEGDACGLGEQCRYVRGSIAELGTNILKAYVAVVVFVDIVQNNIKRFILDGKLVFGF